MSKAFKNPRHQISKVIEVAGDAGFIITERRTQDKITLDITHDPEVYQFEAHFRKSLRTNVWRWEAGYQYRDGGGDKIYAMRRFIDRIKENGKSKDVPGSPASSNTKPQEAGNA